VPDGASGSSTIRARDRVFSGTFANERGGFTLAPSQVYFGGIIPFWENAALEIEKSLMLLSSPGTLRLRITDKTAADINIVVVFMGSPRS
jgi:hypothetical protein